MEIRPERPGDEAAIADLIDDAFAGAEHGDGTEASIVERLRREGALAVSLVAEVEGAIVGQVAFSKIAIDGRDAGWFGLGPVAVSPPHQHCGIGEALIRDGLDRLRANGAAGCVVLGEPAYYRRFGFIADARLAFPGPPSEYFQALSFGGNIPRGTIAYHPAFG